MMQKRAGGMRITGRPSLVLGVAAYLAALGMVVVGGTCGAHSLLANAEKPAFLIFEHSAKTKSQDELPTVGARPYTPPPPISTPWKPSLVQGYVVKTKPHEGAKQSVTEAHEKQKTARLKRQPRKQNREAMDAYAQGFR
jgi:hypothetical protein